MKNIAAIIVFPVISCFVLTACLQEGHDTLTIAAAANTRYAVEELSQAFTRTTGIACKTIISSSGKLTAQIREGAPYDVFISADMKYPDRLFREGFTTAAPQCYAYGSLVLWSLDTTLIHSAGILPGDDIRLIKALLANDKSTHIALANPRTAPYGVAALETLKHAQIDKTGREKLVYGESISQVNHFIASGTAEIGFTSLSSVIAGETKDRGNWMELDTSLYTPIAQGIVLIKNRKAGSGQAPAFYAFLFSGEGQRILHKFGYKTRSDKKAGVTMTKASKDD